MKKSSILLLILMYLIAFGVLHFNRHLGLISHNQPKGKFVLTLNDTKKTSITTGSTYSEVVAALLKLG